MGKGSLILWSKVGGGSEMKSPVSETQKRGEIERT